MTWPDRIGRLRFWQLLGDPYVNIIREALKPALGMTFVSSYLGATPVAAVVFGIGAMLVLLLMAIVFGWLVSTYHVYRAQVSAERDANPVTSRTLQLLEQIALNTRAVVPWSCQDVEP